MAKEQYTAYIKLRDRLCIQIHTIQESKVSIFFNKQEKTDRNMHKDKTDAITRDNKTGICVLIGIGVSGNRSVMKEKKLSPVTNPWRKAARSKENLRAGT